MAREQRWPDQPNGSHQPQDPKPAVDNCLNCCVVVLIAGLIGILIFVFEIAPHIVIPF